MVNIAKFVIYNKLLYYENNMKINKYDEDEKDTKFSFKNYTKALIYVKKYKKELIIVFILNLLSIVSLLSFTKVLEKIIDIVIPSGDYNKLFIMVAIAISLIILSLLLTKVHLKTLSRVNFKIVEEIRNDLFAHIQYFPFKYYDSMPHGKILIKLTDYAEKVSDLITDKLVTTILNFINSIIIFIFMLCTNIELTLAIVGGMIALISIFVVSANQKRKYRLKINNKEANINAYLVESLKGRDITKAFNREKENQKIFNNLSDEWKNENCKSLKVANLGWFSVQIISHVVTAIIYFVGVAILYPSITVGKIIAMGNYSLKLWGPMETIFSNLDEFINSITYLERILEMLDEPIQIDDKEAKNIDIIGKIEFKDVNFSYIKENQVLNGVSFQIMPNEKVAIVGETGSGKTTIANLITRFYDIDSGQILIDGINIRNIKINKLRKQISVMQQENYLFSTTIMNNLKCGNENIKDEKIIEICKECNVDDWIMTLKNGYYTTLINNGENLSDGERQIICYLRIIINNPRIIILDEATSKIDVKTEKMLQNLTKKMIENKTVITIAHRLSTIINCDKIFLLKDNKIVEEGTHKELLNKKQEYYKLFVSQDNY